MPTRMLSHQDVVTIISINIGAVTISLTDIELYLRIASLGAAVGYTIWKWVREYKKR